ncbi:uncharacterized protein LOC134224336 [Armigeres subalbatus]|uniref:uncharacterized protein LOC134224336 n=1 Tax=Armigeres subalbatus TaxID=124917 RepID=UPI002ED53AE4
MESIISEEQNQHIVDDLQLATNQKTPLSTKKRIKPKKQPKNYTEQHLRELIRQVQNGSMTMYQVNKYYGIPRSTLQFRLSNKYKHQGRSGRLPVVLRNEEEEICKFLRTMIERGFPITRHRLQHTISCYIKRNPRANPFRNNIPGRRWIAAFLDRNSYLSLSTQETIPAEKFKVNEDDINSWFTGICNFLESRNLAYILEDPSRILSGDASKLCIPTCYQRKNGHGKTTKISIMKSGIARPTVTVMYTVSADGAIMPPYVLLPRQWSQELVRSFPKDLRCGNSATESMNTPEFIEYVETVLHPTLTQSNVKFPVLYFVDGHQSHAAFEAVDICEKLGIILIALYPDPARMLLPIIKNIFRSLKSSWNRVIHESKTPVTMLTFWNVLQKTNRTKLTKCKILSAFERFGLFPFSRQIDTTIKPQFDPLVEIPSSILQQARDLIGQEKIYFLNSHPVQCMTQEDKALHYILNNILSLSTPAPAVKYESPADLTETTNLKVEDSNDEQSEDTVLDDNEEVEYAFEVDMDLETDVKIEQDEVCDETQNVEAE